MKFIRIGNDIPFTWTITRLGKPVDINPALAEVHLYDHHHARCDISYSFDGNTVKGLFAGKDQHAIGEYSLVFIQNRDDLSMSTIDAVGCWKLVAHTFLERGRDCGAIITENISFETDMAAPANGLSAYDIAVEHGFVGSVQEWLDSLIQKSYMHILQDTTNPTIWNLLDYKETVVSSFVIPIEAYIQRGVYDNETGLLTFWYNTDSGRESFSVDLRELQNLSPGQGLYFDKDGCLSIRIAKKSHKALSVDDEGLALDGAQFASAANELFTELYVDRLYPDY